MISVVKTILQAVLTVAAVSGKELLQWVKLEARKAARAARALAVWLAGQAAVRVALYSAVVLLVEAFATYIVTYVVTPLAGNLFSRLLPHGNKGEFFYFIFWDSGLNAKRIADVLILYVANYTLLWSYFDRWLRGMSIALSAYSNGLRRHQAILNTSLK